MSHARILIHAFAFAIPAAAVFVAALTAAAEAWGGWAFALLLPLVGMLVLAAFGYASLLFDRL